MFALNFRDQLASIKQVLVDELDQVVASAQSRWYAQHTDTGGHGVVTATSLTTGALAASTIRVPLLGATQLITFDDYVENETVTLAPGKTLYWFDRGLVAPATCIISRILRPGSQPGDVIFLSEAPRNVVEGTVTGIYLARFPDTQLTLEPEGRLLFPQGAATSLTTGDGTDNYRVIELNGDSLLPFMYIQGQAVVGTGGSPDGAWVLIGHKDY